MIYSEPLISKELFVEILDTIRDREDLVCKIDNIVREYRVSLKDDFLDVSSIIIGGEEEILKLLEILMKDTSGNIGYYMWECNFGRDFEFGDFMINDVKVDLSTAEKLYDYLVEANFNGKYI